MLLYIESAAPLASPCRGGHIYFMLLTSGYLFDFVETCNIKDTTAALLPLLEHNLNEWAGWVFMEYYYI